MRTIRHLEFEFHSFEMLFSLVVSTPGIMAKTAGDVASIFGAMMENNLHNHYDPKVVPLGWDLKVQKLPNFFSYSTIKSVLIPVLIQCMSVC